MFSIHPGHNQPSAAARHSDSERAELLDRLEQAEGARHWASTVTSREEKRELYLEAFTTCGQVLDQTQDIALIISASNGRGYSAMELARLAFFEWRECRSLDPVRAQELARELEEHIALYAFPNFYRVIGSSDLSEDLTKGLPRAYSGYSFSSSLLAEYFDCQAKCAESASARELSRRSLTYAATAIKYGLKGLKADPENDHAHSACSRSLALFKRLASEFEQPQTLAEARQLHSTARGLRNQFEETSAFLSSRQLNDDARGLLRELDGAIRDFASPTDAIMSLYDSLPALFVKVAVEEQFSNLEEFNILIQAYVESVSPLLLPEIDKLNYDFADVILTQAIASNGKRIWNLNELLKVAHQADALISPAVLAQRVGERTNSGWFGLDFEVQEEVEGPSDKEMRMTASAADRRLKKLRPVHEHLGRVLVSLEGWTSPEDLQRLSQGLAHASARLERFSALTGRMMPQTEIMPEDEVELSRLYEGRGKEQGCSELFAAMERKIEFFLRKPTEAVAQLSSRARACGQIFSKTAEINPGPETAGLLGRAEELLAESADLSNPGKSDFLSFDRCQELSEDVSKLEEEARASAGRASTWRALDMRLEALSEQAEGIELPPFLIALAAEAEAGRQSARNAVFGSAHDSTHEISECEAQIAGLEERAGSARNAWNEYVQSVAAVREQLAEARELSEFAVTGRDRAKSSRVTNSLAAAVSFEEENVRSMTNLESAREGVLRNRETVAEFNSGIVLLRQMHAHRLLEAAWPALAFLASSVFMERRKMMNCPDETHHPQAWKLFAEVEDLLLEIFNVDATKPREEVRKLWMSALGRLGENGTLKEMFSCGPLYSGTRMNEKKPYFDDKEPDRKIVSEGLDETTRIARLVEGRIFTSIRILKERKLEGCFSRFPIIYMWYCTDDVARYAMLATARRILLGPDVGDFKTIATDELEKTLAWHIREERKMHTKLSKKLPGFDPKMRLSHNADSIPKRLRVPVGLGRKYPYEKYLRASGRESTFEPATGGRGVLSAMKAVLRLQ